MQDFVWLELHSPMHFVRVAVSSEVQLPCCV